MHKSARPRRAAAHLAMAGLAVASLWLAARPAAAAEWDLLLRPSRPSVHSLQSMRTALARAGNRLVSVGEAGIVLLSDDNGVNWRQAKVPVSVLLTNVFFISASHGWAVGQGGVILVTTDGGESWSKQLDGKQAAGIEMAAAQAASAAAADDPKVKRRLSDARRLVQDGADKPFLDIRFFDDQHGMAVGAYGLAFVTADGGTTWQSLFGAIDNPRGNHLYAIVPAQNALFIAGEEGSVFRSTDGGSSFQALTTPGKGTYFGAITGRGGEIVAFGLRGDAFRSADGGTSWHKIEMPSAGLNGGTRLADGSLIIVDDWGQVLKSTDGGQTFAPVGAAQPMALQGVVEAADGSLVVAGNQGAVRVAPAAR